MSRFHRRSAFAALPLAILLASAAPASAGPPWISVEYPANPFDQMTRGALALVHTYHHGRLVPFTMTGTAEGLVSGRRRSIPLALRPTSQAGVYAVQGELPQEGVWVLVVNLTDREAHVAASVLVVVDERGELTGIRVPQEAELAEGRWVIPRMATEEDIDSLLRSTAAMAQARRDAGITQAPRRSLGILLGGLGALLLVPVGGLALRRR